MSFEIISDFDKTSSTKLSLGTNIEETCLLLSWVLYRCKWPWSTKCLLNTTFNHICFTLFLLKTRDVDFFFLQKLVYTSLLKPSSLTSLSSWFDVISWDRVILWTILDTFLDYCIAFCPCVVFFFDWFVIIFTLADVVCKLRFL